MIPAVGLGWGGRCGARRCVTLRCVSYLWALVYRLRQGRGSPVLLQKAISLPDCFSVVQNPSLGGTLNRIHVYIEGCSISVLLEYKRVNQTMDLDVGLFEWGIGQWRMEK